MGSELEWDETDKELLDSMEELIGYRPTGKNVFHLRRALGEPTKDFDFEGYEDLGPTRQCRDDEKDTIFREAGNDIDKAKKSFDKYRSEVERIKLEYKEAWK